MENHRLQTRGRTSKEKLSLANKRSRTVDAAPAPGLEGVAGSFVEVPLHGDPVGRVGVEIHDGVIVGDVLETGQSG